MVMNMSKQKDTKKKWRLISVYTPPDIEGKLRKRAEENRRSLSAEIVTLLEGCLKETTPEK